MRANRRRRTIAEAGLVLAAVVGLSACHSSGGTKVSSNPPTPQAPGGATTQAPAPTHAPATTQAPATTAKPARTGGVSY